MAVLIFDDSEQRKSGLSIAPLAWHARRPVYLASPSRVLRGCQLAEFVCHSCGQVNHHALPLGMQPNELLLRQSHCKCWRKRGGYYLVLQAGASLMKIEAERRAGEMLAEMDKCHGARDGKTELHHATPLSELGIEKTQSHQWQRMAALSEGAT